MGVKPLYEALFIFCLVWGCIQLRTYPQLYAQFLAPDVSLGIKSCTRVRSSCLQGKYCLTPPYLFLCPPPIVYFKASYKGYYWRRKTDTTATQQVIDVSSSSGEICKNVFLGSTFTLFSANPFLRCTLQCLVSSCCFSFLFFAESEAECAMQLRRIGDKLNFRQKILNLIAKLFHSGTWALPGFPRRRLFLEGSFPPWEVHNPGGERGGGDYLVTTLSGRKMGRRWMATLKECKRNCSNTTFCGMEELHHFVHFKASLDKASRRRED